jgi:hypothetical protein
MTEDCPLIEREAHLLLADPDRVAMTHDMGGCDHKRETFRQTDRILYLNPRPFEEMLRTVQSALPPLLNASVPCLRTLCLCAVRRSIIVMHPKGNVRP